MSKRVIVAGLEPPLVDFAKTSPSFNPLTLVAALNDQVAALAEAGYAASILYLDTGETAEAVLAQAIAEEKPDCICIGAGVRNNPAYFLLFEKLVNVIHAKAPAAKLCFNTGPGDTMEAVRRWI
ncbi:MAG TPA: hypothetical protein VGB91_03555 [Rhizomicrobium sp.]